MFSTIQKIVLAFGFFISVHTAFAQGGVLPIHVNYSESDKAIYGGSYDYKSYRSNAQLDSLATGMIWVVCDTFPDLISGNFYSKDFLPIVRLDSLRIRINHVRHSSQNDTLILSLAGTFNGIFPHENNFYGDTIVLNASFAPGNIYASSAYLTIPVGEYVPNSFSVLFAFKGAQNDTLSFWSGYGYDGICAEQPSLNRAQFSNFYPNSFAYRKEFGQILPTFDGDDIFFECDTTLGFDTLTDGRNYIQNWDVDFYLTATTAGVSENVLSDSPLLYPNPGFGQFFMQESCTQISIVSMSGKEVWRGVPNANSIYLPLPAGFYVARIETESGTRIEKLIITEQ